MRLFDVAGNLHLHTIASDGTGTHDEVAEAAAQAGLDFLIYTDHNTWVEGVTGWYREPESGRRILRLMGQELHDQSREPEVNHLLCHFVESDLNHVVKDPQTLIDTARRKGGLTFLAHPLERPGYGRAAVMFPWVDWGVEGFTGIELWNAMSDVKWRLRTVPRGLLGAYLPKWVLVSPFEEVLAKWDELTRTGCKVVAIGNSDAHAWPISLGPLTRTMYSYEYLFGAVNTHLLLAEPLADEAAVAQIQIYEALRAGHCYVSNDLVASPQGFSFSGRSGKQRTIMGDTLRLHGEVELTATSPRQADLRLIKDGTLIAEKKGTELQWRTREPGVYRIEAHRRFWGYTRGWVYTNPIYVQS